MNRPTFLATAILLCSNLSLAAEPDPLFASDAVLAITLTAPFDTIDDEREADKEYEGTLSYVDDNGSEVVLDASFEVRGNWRLDPRNCAYSQLWVDLRRGQLPGTLFENQNRLKLVVQCRRQDRYAEYIHKERQVYRIFALRSDYNFDTRALEVTYIDSEDPDEIRTHVGFFIEHQNRLAERFQMAEVEENLVGQLDLNRLQSTLVSMFMYMIGNTDFSLIQGPPDDECCHNSKLLEAENTEYFPVPYDFDASGFVDTSYAPLPNPEYRIRNNRSRVYRGFCVDDATVIAAAARFQEAREAIMDIVGNDPHVSSRVTRSNVRFMEDFFEILDDEEELRDEIIDECRG